MKGALFLFSFSSLLWAQAEPLSLLDKDLSQWEIFMGVPHESIQLEGYQHEPHTNHMTGRPLGLGQDPLQVFQMIEEEGEPVLLVSGQIYAGLTSKKEFSNYHLTLDFKWGEKKWEPRLQAKRDSGLLFHCVGNHGAFWKVWMRSLEFQIQEGDCGDFIPLAGAEASVPVGPQGFQGKNQPVYTPEGELRHGMGYLLHGPSEEKPHGEWNTLELYTVGERALFVVNGVPNMMLFDTRQKGPGGEGEVPLTAGKIQLQSEAAEIYFRRLELTPIEEFPEEYEAVVTRPAGESRPW
ncbi:3-keto-disaccharide hydrolase [Roseibacillus ishigakijimensis]|uniref:DUF1080 domain-containing protein n=1 Tax=Roseibacillus ishigakijimensis TaxID=454146 RepID=A0A934RWN2_9BACT|nr:DUF1080 domain-containing protein [Roseibacillus ishigakijimensis]MBK1835515.1 DUF1080 domain-containing protein [Roseibacillus ishigakijimensis]